ncbi:MAG: IS66 family transposase [Actinobacteria bacterium]|nr:IS66 family transposase [Actinomycetota bacterium]
MVDDLAVPGTPSVEKLCERLAQRDVLIEALSAELGAARARIAELEARLGQSSRNSSKPPSSDGLAKPAPKSLRRRGGRKPGGQDGHPGSTLAPVAVPDEVITHEPVCCRGCGDGLGGAPEVGREHRQVFDIPPMQVRVSEHQLIKRRCGCGTVTSAEAPEGVSAAVQYGPRITAIIVYLYVGQFLSKKRTAAALAELFGTPVSQGTVAAMTTRAAGELGGFTEWVRANLAAAEVVNFDETGLRVEGKLRWVHSASTGKYSLIFVHDRRGTKGMDAAGVLPEFSGIAVHDAWAPYDTYTSCTHALCGAHVLRELQAVTDLAPEGQWCWATQAGDALRELNQLVNDALAVSNTLENIDPAALSAAVHRYRSAALLGVQATDARTSKLMGKHNALARRLIDRQDDYLRFTLDPRVPFDNNAAEREIRMIKLRQKVSGCLRTLTGAGQFCAIRSYLATAAKHGIHFFAALTTLAEGRPWLPETV